MLGIDVEGFKGIISNVMCDFLRVLRHIFGSAQLMRVQVWIYLPASHMFLDLKFRVGREHLHAAVVDESLSVVSWSMCCFTKPVPEAFLISGILREQFAYIVRDLCNNLHITSVHRNFLKSVDA